MQWNMIFYFLENSNKKSHFNVVLFSIGHYRRESYVATRFSPLQGRKNQMVAYVFGFIVDSNLLF
jgi:hypothetical protein